ncbi:MAG: hypothetical protein EBU90_15800 [Proteobacteria bacterium]|nr:hypothetical protein [Pseudomonadota bacterium]NBP15967.1 hypothetical protein [bacterium]
MTKYEIEEFIICSCYSEGIYLVKHKNESELYLSIFSRGINPKRFNWKDKFRYIWHALISKKPFEDEVVLDKAAVAKLKKVLNKF